MDELQLLITLKGKRLWKMILKETITIPFKFSQSIYMYFFKKLIGGKFNALTWIVVGWIGSWVGRKGGLLCHFWNQSAMRGFFVRYICKVFLVSCPNPFLFLFFQQSLIFLHFLFFFFRPPHWHISEFFASLNSASSSLLLWNWYTDSMAVTACTQRLWLICTLNWLFKQPKNVLLLKTWN